jgi:hypothetical protein
LASDGPAARPLPARPLPARPHGDRAAGRYAALAATCLVAVVVAVAGSFVHRWASPFGVLLAVAGAAAVAVLAVAVARSRLPLILVAALWSVPVVALTQPGPGNDLVVAGDAVGLAFLFGGFTCHALAVGVGGTAGRSRRVT